MPTSRVYPALTSASLALLALGACVPRTAPPAPVSAPAPRPAPLPPAPSPSPTVTDWETGPLTPADWPYRADARAPTAVFGDAGLVPSLALICMPGQIGLVLSRAEGDPVVVRTSFGE